MLLSVSDAEVQIIPIHSESFVKNLHWLIHTFPFRSLRTEFLSPEPPFLLCHKPLIPKSSVPFLVLALVQRSMTEK